MLRAEALFLLARCILNLDVWGERGMLLSRELVGRASPSRLVVGSLSSAADLVLSWVAASNGGDRPV